MAKFSNPLPLYEVEFIPTERRINDRRQSSPRAGQQAKVERRQQDRRQDTQSASQSL